ncbi:IS110 family transposase [Actinoplanes couchii]|uniref:IS110 family transposase n=1 Tax=Actinoplanes couchii TaxID=403638 RepID=A0ABQ3XUJ8_9ACTN|nr:IS110 family transposase [Actinoplanes couchii]MDR6317343.1 transposase [Actinoplanes couchii]MDR6318491.1 transposase [Actinoplanes couchii]GID62115.1 IS110 family transposase [Actinoplanes couchii]
MSSTRMPHPAAGQQTGSGEVVVGVDTHKDFHVAVALTTAGAMLGSQRFPATADGYRRLLAWARSHGEVRRAGVECTSSYGAALTRYLLGEGVDVIEVGFGDKATRRRRGKSDVIDAEVAARAVLAGTARAVAKTTDGPVEMIRLFKLAKNSAIKARTQSINQLKAVLVNADPALREPLSGLGPKTLLHRCLALRLDHDPHDPNTATVYTLQLLARRIQALSTEIDDLNKQLTTVIAAHWPHLLQQPGIGPDSAATLLITAGDNPERLHNESSFAALCGTSPVEASSGKSRRRRLNRGGDRQANAALYRIVLSRLRLHPPTRAYRDRRTAEGKTTREIMRCLKRYIAREIYGLLSPQPAT